MNIPNTQIICQLTDEGWFGEEKDAFEEHDEPEGDFHSICAEILSHETLIENCRQTEK